MYKENISRIILLLIINSYSINNLNAQRVEKKPSPQDCKLIIHAFNRGIKEYYDILKRNTIHYENNIGVYDECINQNIRDSSLTKLVYSNNDTIIFLTPKLVVSLSYYNPKLKFVRMGLHGVQYKGSKNWESSLYGNIEIYFERRKNSTRIKKIIRNL